MQNEYQFYWENIVLEMSTSNSICIAAIGILKDTY